MDPYFSSLSQPGWPSFYPLDDLEKPLTQEELDAFVKSWLETDVVSETSSPQSFTPSNAMMPSPDQPNASPELSDLPGAKKRKARSFASELETSTKDDIANKKSKQQRDQLIQIGNRVETLSEFYRASFPSAELKAPQLQQNVDHLPQEEQEDLKFAVYQKYIPQVFEQVILNSIDQLDETQKKEETLQARIKQLDQENQQMKSSLIHMKRLFPQLFKAL